MVFRLIKKILNGKTLFRFLTEESLMVEFKSLNGEILDLASGSASYSSILPDNIVLVKTDLNPKNENTVRVDCDQKLPFEDSRFNGVLFINALYTLNDREAFVKEVYRVIRPGGRLIMVSPFIANEMPEPHDYCRLSYEGISKLLSNEPWSSVLIKRIGERFSSSANLLHPAMLFAPVRLVIYSLALVFDSLVPKRARDRHPTPLGYTITAIK